MNRTLLHMNPSQRWQMNRAGIINVYQYENETLDFGGGRLLLRGVNGSGKSTAMNMLLPFLLTGNARGIDAAGEQTGVLRSWMLSGRDEPQPVGYLWLEFARTVQPSTEVEPLVDYLAIGCGIKANQASNTVSTWWFITSQRPGIEFGFVEQGIPLSIDSLRNVLGLDPVFTHDRRNEYRHAIRQRLYGGADIGAYLELINTVRNPRVGDRIDVDLPTYLSDSLPGLSDQALNDAARPLDDLDEHRRNVGDLQATHLGLNAIAGVYKRYVLTELFTERVDARAVVSSARTAIKRAQRAAKELTKAQDDEITCRDKSDALNATIKQLQTQIGALEDSSAYKEGQQLEDLRVQVVYMRAQQEKYTQEHDKLLQRQSGLADRLRELEQRTRNLWSSLQGELKQLARVANEVNLSVQAPVAAPLSTVSLADEHGINELLENYPDDSLNKDLKIMSGSVLQRKADVATIVEQHDSVVTAWQSFKAESKVLERTVRLVQKATVAFDESRVLLEAARRHWDEAVDQWLSHANHVQPHTELLAERHTRRSYLNKQNEQRLDTVQQELAHCEAEYKLAHETVVAAQAELDELNARTEPEPPHLPWQGRGELCLAELVDFDDSLSGDARARLEAALEASGLLSASISDVEVRLATGDLLILPGQPVAHPLSDYLTVSKADTAPAQINVDRVQHILNCISTDLKSTAESVVTLNGEFRLGSLTGRHDKSAAEYVGASARRARLERLRQEAAERLNDAQRALQLREDARNELDELRQELDRLRTTLPSLRELDIAEIEAREKESQLEEAREAQRVGAAEVAEAEKRLTAVEDEWQRQCRTLTLPTAIKELHAIERTLESIERDCDTASRTCKTLCLAGSDWAAGTNDWRQLLKDIVTRAESLELARNEYQSSATRLATLEDSLGASYQEVVASIAAVRSTLNESESALPSVTTAQEEAIREHQKALNERDNAQSQLNSNQTDCQSTHARLTEVLNVPGLLATLVRQDTKNEASESDATDVVHEVNVHTQEDADGLDTLLRSLDVVLEQHENDGTSADGLRQSLRARRDTLGAGWDAEDRQPNTDYPLSISVNGPLGTMTLPESLSAVDTQLARLTALLSEKQDQALRNLLQGLIAKEVAEKMFQARRLVNRMNEHLGKVTSGHGIGIRLRWRQSPELDEAEQTTVDILGKLPDLRTPDEETTLRESLALRLEEARRLAPDARYRDLIAEVFDYRRWHDMAVMLQRPGDTEKRLSRRTPLSEGEKKMVTYLPSFAAVAAACDALADSGGASVPRFVLLDDAFAKVSEDNHAALFGLLVTLDLDFIATSERLWGTHASVPALTITEVVRDASLGAILLEHSHWNGTHLYRTPSDEGFSLT